jgi:flagellar protein FlbT
MTALILELKQGESMILNGAVIRFKTRTRLELNTQARFLFGKQIMREEDAATPARRAYFALQQAYVGAESDRPNALAAARLLITGFRDRAAPGERPIWDDLLAASETEAGFEALKIARQMIRSEDFETKPTPGGN